VLAAAAGNATSRSPRTWAPSRAPSGCGAKRFATARLAGLEKDAPRGGRPPARRQQQARRIVEATTQTKPAAATHWSTRTLAEHLHVSASMVQRVWKANGLRPHLSRTFKLSNDKKFVEKLTDVVGLYLNPPEHALVLSCDEKSQIQALDRTSRACRSRRAAVEPMTHDYKRNGTTTLFAALELAQGKLIGTCLPRHRHQEWIKFLKLIDQETPPDLDLHLIADNYFTHKTPQVQRLAQETPALPHALHPHQQFLVQPDRTLVRELTDKMIRRSAFKSVAALIEAILRFVEHHNDQPKTFVWTAKVDDILAKISRARRCWIMAHQRESLH